MLESVHPSPLSAAGGFVSGRPRLAGHGGRLLMFEQFDCGHFKKANEWLKVRYGEAGQIDWNLNVAPEEAGV